MRAAADYRGGDGWRKGMGKGRGLREGLGLRIKVYGRSKIRHPMGRIKRKKGWKHAMKIKEG